MLETLLLVLALIIAIHRHHKTIRLQDASALKG